MWDDDNDTFRPFEETRGSLNARATLIFFNYKSIDLHYFNGNYILHNQDTILFNMIARACNYAHKLNYEITHCFRNELQYRAHYARLQCSSSFHTLSTISINFHYSYRRRNRTEYLDYLFLISADTFSYRYSSFGHVRGRS